MSERVDAKTFLAELNRKPSAKGSEMRWGGWEPRACSVCGRRILLRETSFHSFHNGSLCSEHMPGIAV